MRSQRASDKQGSAATATSVLIVDDHQGFREGLRLYLGLQPEIRVVAEARNGEEAIRLAQAHRPDVILLDLDMPGAPGLETLRRIKADRPETKVIVVTMHSEEPYRDFALENGADAFVSKTAVMTHLIPAIRQVMGEGRKGGDA